MQKKNTTSRRQRTQKIVLTASSNALGFNEGDTVEVKPAAWKDGDLVAYETGTGRICAAYLFHSKGKNFAYFIKPSLQTSSRAMLNDFDVKRILGLVVRNEVPPAKAKKSGERVTYKSDMNWDYFGLHEGDRITIEKNGQAPIGKLILIEDKDEQQAPYLARVCSVSKATVRTTGDARVYHTDSPLGCVVGPVVEITHEGCDHTRIKKLRQTMAELQNADDAWSNATRCYEIEREIYDLEHPVEEEEEDDDFEWPEEIDG